MRFALRQIRWQIAVVYTLLILLLLAGLAAVQYVLMRGSYMRTMEQGTVGQAYLVAALTEALVPEPDPARLDALVDTMSQRLAARVTVIDTSGDMLADSLLPAEEYANRMDRPEVAAALRYGLGEMQRYSTTTRDNRFYVAVPFYRDGMLAGVARVGVPLTTIATAQAQIGASVLATALLAAAISVALAVLLAGRTTRPLLELREMAGRLAAGELDVQVPLPQGEEVAALALSFNRMAGQLRQLVEDQARERERLAAILATMHDGILILDADDRVGLANRAAATMLGIAAPAGFPVAELPVGPALLRAAEAAHHPDAAEAAQLIDELSPRPSGRSLRAIVTPLGGQAGPQTLVLIQDLTELRRAERSRRLQLTNLTHDLRTPLASLQALLDTLIDGALDDPETARDFLGRMDVEVQGLSHLVQEQLELARLELGQVALRRAPADMTALLGEAVERMAAQAHQREVAIVFAADALPTLTIDRARIQQVLLNLLQNALSYTPPGGRITLGAARRGEEVVVSVADTGVGIALADLPHIFDRFFKADPSRHDGGMGLGLAIAQQLVERHGGRIWAESTPGRGTTVSLALPIAPALQQTPLVERP